MNCEEKNELIEDPYAIVSEVADEEVFIKVCEEEDENTFVELPAEEDGTMLLSTLQGQYPSAVGLKYKSSSGSWRGIRITENVLKPPSGGWGDLKYFVTSGKELAISSSKSVDRSEKPSVDLKKDLFVINLADEVNDDVLKEYFTEHCGEMELHEVKYDRTSGKSRGFGFIRFKTIEATKEALNGEHVIADRKLEIRVSRKKEIPCQLFVGRLPEGTAKEDLREHFEEFGEITDCYITSPFRGFGFVTYASSEIAHAVLRKPHEIKGASLNVAVAEPKEDKSHRGRNRDSYRGRDSRRDDYGDSKRSRRDRSRDRGSRYDYPDVMDQFKGMIYEMMNQRRR